MNTKCDDMSSRCFDAKKASQARDLEPEPEKSPDVSRIFPLIIHVVTLREDTLVSPETSGFLQRFISGRERDAAYIYIPRPMRVFIYAGS